MDTITVFVFIISIVFAAVTMWATITFVRRKNPTKIGNTEKKKEEIEKSAANEIEDPLNPTQDNY